LFCICFAMASSVGAHYPEAACGGNAAPASRPRRCLHEARPPPWSAAAAGASGFLHSFRRLPSRPKLCKFSAREHDLSSTSRPRIASLKRLLPTVTRRGSMRGASTSSRRRPWLRQRREHAPPWQTQPGGGATAGATHGGGRRLHANLSHLAQRRRALSSREPTRAPNLVWIAEMRRRRCQTWEASVRVKSTRDAVGG